MLRLGLTALVLDLYFAGRGGNPLGPLLVLGLIWVWDR
jgi:hypothetical protein